VACLAKDPRLARPLPCLCEAALYGRQRRLVLPEPRFARRDLNQWGENEHSIGLLLKAVAAYAIRQVAERDAVLVVWTYDLERSGCMGPGSHIESRKWETAKVGRSHC